ncbi:uncharacterized protein SCHCODRAFT_02695786 [Schizophyllum commune H4-8]|uniref:Uncharacterized protein n=1 Tax=Schizophyllum commune (strain H4-8 / FGSC 9210) TaxID=578458 RepID=D8PUW0_SCHCM|nr:uncharacterized protein SCHCODRAFT_02695786 [Schizophyllum commune H4-8]KAI5900599.1 hypothetical protein SCHCODRAFT_02695786 [Schizophyllum commune H4-8]
MAPRLAYKTTNTDGHTCYWYYKRQPPYKRPQRTPEDRQQLLDLLFPMPPALDSDWRASCRHDESEYERCEAIEQLRHQLKRRVYTACFSAPSGRPEDDPCDPILDYTYLKRKLDLVSLYMSRGGRHCPGDYIWESLPPFTWAAEDALHAQLAQQDVHMQNFVAQGGDPQPEVYLGWVDDDEGVEEAT